MMTWFLLIKNKNRADRRKFYLDQKVKGFNFSSLRLFITSKDMLKDDFYFLEQAFKMHSIIASYNTSS